jgi:general secretion pathway protein G
MNIPPTGQQQGHKKTSGFTLIEIVIVLTIISILGAGVMMMTKSWIDTSKETRTASDLDKIALALQGYEMKAMRLPTTEQGITALVEKPTVEPIPDRWTNYIEEVPKDPWLQPYKYINPGVKSKRGYDIWSVGPDGQDGSADDIGNWKSTATK